MALIYLMCGFSVLLSGLAVALENKGLTVYKYICKSMASLCFVFAALIAMAKAEEIQSWHLLVLSALILGMLGDIFLSTNSITADKKTNELTDIIGALFFLSGHLLYSAWLINFISDFNFWLLLILLAVPATMVVFEKTKLMNLGKRFIPSLFYGVVIGLMLASAINAGIILGGGIGNMIIIAGSLFTISDGMLTLVNFGKLKKNWLKYFYMVPYYIAQSLFALTILY